MAKRKKGKKGFVCPNCGESYTRMGRCIRCGTPWKDMSDVKPEGYTEREYPNAIFGRAWDPRRDGY